MIPFSDEELKPVVLKALEAIQPSLELDGGGVVLLDVKDGKVFVRLKGACVGCASAGQTLKFGIEKKLQLEIHPEIEVVNVPEGQGCSV